MRKRILLSVVLLASLLVGAGKPAAPAAPTTEASLPALPAQPSCVRWPTNGWPTGPLPTGVDPAAVEAAGEVMVGPNAGDSVVVIHGGRLVYEKYADGITRETILPSYSVSKSFTSTVVGLLVDEGRLALDARAPIAEWAGASDPRRAITLRNILHMSSGLQWEENYVDVQSDVIQMVASGDEAGFVIAKPLESTPGSVWEYSTGDTAVLGRIIGTTAGVSGDSYDAFLHQRLFDPLGINPVEPGFDMTGTWRSGWMTNTTTRNFAKLGLLYLRHGVWENRQFLSSDWVDFVRTPSPGYSGYGGQFWLNADGSFEMVGLYGQNVHIVPQLDLVIAVNNGFGSYPMVDVFRNAQPVSCPSKPFSFLPPIHDGTNRHEPGRPVLVQFTTPGKKKAVSAIASVAVHCKTGAALGPRTPIAPDLQSSPRRKAVWFSWPTKKSWTGCRDLEISTTDGAVHQARFRWVPRRAPAGARP